MFKALLLLYAVWTTPSHANAAIFSRGLWDVIPHSCLQDLLTNKPTSSDCQKKILVFFKQENIPPPDSFEIEQHMPFQTECSCGLCSLSVYLHSTLESETQLLKDYFQTEIWRKSLILDGCLTRDEHQRIQDTVHSLFYTSDQIPPCVSYDPIFYWESFFLYSQQSYWTARFGFLEKHDPQIHRFHTDNHPHLITAIRLIRHKLKHSIEFSRKWIHIISPNLSDTLQPEEAEFHRIFKITAENHDQRQSDTFHEKKQKDIRFILDLATHGSKSRQKNKQKVLDFISSQPFQEMVQSLKYTAKSLSDTDTIKSFIYQWVLTVRSLSQLLTKTSDADTTTPLSILLMIIVDDPYIFATLLTLDTIPNKPLNDGWDYYFTLLVSSVWGALDTFEVEDLEASEPL